MYNLRVNNLFENFYNTFTMCNYSNTFFIKYVFYIIILFFRYNNDFIFSFKKRIVNLLKVLRLFFNRKILFLFVFFSFFLKLR